LDGGGSCADTQHQAWNKGSGPTHALLIDKRNTMMIHKNIFYQHGYIKKLQGPQIMVLNIMR
jgi:hypothetical protein